MATATPTAAASPDASLSEKILNPQSQQFGNRFAFHEFLRKEYRFGLDPNRRTCPLFVQGHCPMGNSCPDKHAVSSSFNKRKMPECNFFVRNGYCSNGEECLYLHVDPDSKIPPCPHFENGFCPLGPTCSKKHVRKQICKFYLAGFCPDGRSSCKEGTHPKWKTGLPAPTVKKPREEVEKERDGDREGGGEGFRGRGSFERRRFYGGRGRRDRDR